MNKTLLTLSCAVALGASLPPVQAQSLFAALTRGTGAADDVAQVATKALDFGKLHEPWARPYMSALYRDGEWGAVLNFNRLGLAAMELQRFDLARKSFDAAITRVEAIYADDPNAAKARSVFNAEKLKDWKGEPYERTMLYYYRGLLYAHEGDWQNARASFLAADRHDTLSSAEDQAYEGDFGLMKYLAGWASACDGDTVRAGHLIAEARAADAVVRALPERPGRMLLLVDSGAAPVKWGDGPHKEILRFRASEGDDGRVELAGAGAAKLGTPQAAADLGYQATTRGGREVDGILAGKARFKDNAGAVGDVALEAGSMLALQGGISGDHGTANAGLAGLFIGLIAKGIEQAATPEADLRGWDTLPARLLLASGGEASTAPLSIVVAGQARELPLYARHGACGLAWGRTRSALSPPSDAATQAHEGQRGDRNRAFRTMLTADFRGDQ